MSEMNRVQRWRQQQREAGKDALTIWLPRELKLYVEDIALKRHCSPSDLIQQALTTCYPLSADVADTVTDTIVTDTSQLRLVLQQELQALLYENQKHQGVQAREGVTDTATDTVTVTSQLRTVVEEAVWESMDKWQQYQHLPVVPIVTDTATDTVTDTTTDTTTKTTTAPALPPVTDTVTDTRDPLEPTPVVTDTATDADSAPTAKRQAPSRKRAVTATVSDTVTVAEAKHRGRKPVLRPGILALLDKHPAGLTAAELKVYLGTEKHIGDTLAGMVKAQLLVRNGTGQGLRYQRAEVAGKDSR